MILCSFFLKDYNDFFMDLKTKVNNSNLLEDSLFFYKTSFIKKSGIPFSKARHCQIEKVMGDSYCMFYTQKHVLIAEGIWSFEVFHGDYKEYYPNGVIKIDGLFLSGKKNRHLALL
mgnify:CR=1 FL=1